MPRSFFNPGLPPAANLATAARGVALDACPPVFRIHFGIEHQQVHVAPAGEYMIEAAVADVIGPAVAADDPHAFLHQHVGEGQQLLSLRGVHRLQFLLQKFDALPLIVNVRFIFLRRREQLACETSPIVDASRCTSSRANSVCLSMESLKSQAELGIVFKEGIRPSRSAAVEFLAQGVVWQVPAVDRRAAGRIGDYAAISKKLRNQLQIWRLTATRTRLLRIQTEAPGFAADGYS